MSGAVPEGQTPNAVWLYAAEHAQTEESESNSITQYVGDRINAFIGGILFCLVSEIALHLLEGIWS